MTDFYDLCNRRMFERLAQQVLGKFLSKYFTEESLAENKIYTSTQLGVWSGYVSLENLELKKEFVNSRLRSKAQPFEIVHCTLRRVEITIPWAKLSNPISFRDHRNKEDAVVVVVMDGIHLLARTSFDFDDVALRQEEMKKRRQALADPYRRVDANSEGMSYKEILKKRLKDGLFQEIASKIHIHLRDLHIRLEDTESDPISPHACGITMESMHIQHDDESAANEGVVSKIAQLNHLAVYWNALGYGDALPAENSILHQTCRENREMISRALNFCIARRASMIASPSRDPYIPTHTYLLLPVDGTWHGRLSTNPTDLSDKPAVQVYISINPVFGQLRDFQCVQILRLASEYKNHKYVKRYRRFRPSVSVLDDPTAWWLYAARAIRYQLRETFLRWSWGRFADVYKVRNRYMNLYERKMLFPVLNGDVSDRPSDDVDEASFSQSTPSGGRLDITRQRIEKMRDGPDGTTPDDGAGPSTPIRQEDKKTPLTKADFLELQSLEDGLIGDISIDTILLFRALVNLRLPPATTTPPQSSWRRSLFWPSMVDNDLVQDSEAKVELETLLSYLEKSSGTMATSDTSDADRNAISIVILFEELSLSLLSPLSATSEESPVRQIHEKFLDFSMMDLKIEYYLKGDYEGKEMRLSIGDLVASEIRRDKSHHIVAKQVGKGSRNESGTSDNGDGDPLVVVRHLQSAKNSSGSDVALVVVINLMELSLIPECEWISHVKSLLHHIKKVPNVADYWDNLSLAYVNSLALGRLGLIAKAESAIPEHKNLDAEILVQCPILRIGDGKGGHLVMELGRAHFKTERLAGVPRSQVFPTKGCEDGVGNSSMELPPLDDASVMGSVSGRTWSSRPRLETPSIAEKRTDRQSFFSSAMSVDSKTHGGLGNRSAAGSIYFDEPLVRMNVVDDEMEEERKQEATALNYLFYDVFSFHLQTGKITLCGENDVFEISCGFEMHTVLKKSVLPADHTLCKMKTNSVIKNLKIDLNRNALSMITDAAKAWKALMRSRVSVDSSMLNKYKATFPRITLVEMPSPLEDPSSEDESLSQLDENEFFDANQTNESFVGDGSAVWFDDNWISDAESFIEGDSRSAQDERRRRRRRAGSVSDVSSASDQSTKEPMKDTKGKKIQQGNAYLSAENLARLEEGAGEDESVGESVVDMDDVSFHSVMSEAGQEQVARDLEDNMEQVSQKVEELASQLRDLCQFTDRTSAPEHEMMRKKKTSMRLQLSRARAELNGLRALREDLERLIAENPRANNREGDDGIMKAYRRSAHAKSARALLAARNRRDLVLENNWHHSLTQYLNREIFQGSILVQHCHIMLHLSEDFGEKGSHPSNPTFDFVACHTGLAISHQVHNTKLYLTSDQVSASLREKNDPTIRPKVLFSGGNNDTLLPSHFPHLVSRSMEEKFFRGTFQWGKRRPTDAGSRQTRTLKSRLIVGDVEIFPSKQTLSPLYRLVRHIKAGEHSPTESSRLRPQGSEISEDATLPSIDKHPMYVDLAVRLSSIRLIMGINGKIAGAAVATEAAFRLVQATAPAREKLQVDMRCTNLQILEIYSLEAGHGYEIMGRRDPYNALVQVRLKSQLVAEKNCGGWVVGSENCDLENHPRGSATLARNAHVGLKINPLTLVAAPEAIALLREHAEELAQVFSYETNSRMKSERVETKNKSLVHRLSASYPLRWRFDGSMKRLMVNFPERHRGDWNFADETASHMRMGFSVILCLQESTSHKGHVSMLMALSEVSLIRSNDDWPVLEHFTILCDATVETRIAARYRMSATIAETLATPQLKLDTGSPINEIAAVLHRYGWDSISLQHDKSINYGLILMITPLKVNLTAPIIGLVTQITQSLKGSLLKKKLTNSSDDIPPPSFLDQRQRLGFHIVLEEVELEVMRETETKPMAHAKSLISFTMADTRIDFEQRDQIAASILIRNSSLFDLSSSRGVQVVGENIGGCEKDSPYFVRINLYVDEAKDGPTNITLEINWGSIQCLVMPTFLVSLLQLKDDVASALRRSKTASTCSEKGNILDRFVGFDHDVNLLLSAHADAFECILSSKDISEYVRQSGTESIGVVTLRWKASLTVLLALDTLKGSSVAWLTLNPDGKFTDEADIGLFKDFVNRYLSPSSGLLAGSDEIGQKVMNAFTARLSLHVSDFQVIRTTISAKPLKPPPKPVSYKSAHRICFLVKPPSAGEQRVTNPIDLVLIYKAAGAAMVGTSDGDGVPQVEISQLVEAKARFVDILLYISQSADGFTESFKTTVKPVLEILKNDDSSRRMRNEGHLSTMTANDHFAMNPKRNLVHLLKCAPTMCTVQLEGLQITCVPSGATRLNESPIIKIELKQFSSGLASVPLPFDGRAMRSGTSSKDLLSAVDLMHTNIAGWLACEITGHYHNRRLVAWEPFVEPWNVEFRFGVDAVDAFGLTPIASSRSVELKSPSATRNSLENFTLSSLGDGTGDRLRDFGRLFRAPFQSSLSAKQTTNDRAFISQPDFCYLMLASTSRTTILSVMYSPNESAQERETRLFSRLPRREKIDWLRGFGFPGRENGELYSATCVLSDSKTLNINITGALLENVLGYLHSLKSDELRQVAPHWIRNDTGMVSVRYQR